MTEGHRFLYENFGVYPTIGWQIDPFGHSQGQATMFAEMGFNAFFFARSDYQDYEKRFAEKELEFIWRSSRSLGAETDIFTHIMFDSTYCNWPLYEWATTPPIKFDPRLEGYDLPKKAQEFAQNIEKRQGGYKTSNIFVSFGCDFGYKDARINFKNMDILMKYINEHRSLFGMNVFYSTPATYVKAIHDESAKNDISWSLNEHDFFPYRDHPFAVWAGYFTSRSALKGYIRTRNALEHSVTSLMTAASAVIPSALDEVHYYKVEVLARAMGVAQHHDAVTGTEKNPVASDYAKRLYIGTKEAHEVASNIISDLFNRGHSESKPITFEACRLLNVSVCPATDALSKGKVVPFAVYNSLAYQRYETFRIPVPTADVEVVDRRGATIPSQVYTNADKILILAFGLWLPPMRLESFVIQKSFAAKAEEKPLSSSVLAKRHANGDVTLENNYVRAVFSGDTGRLSLFENKVVQKTIAVDQEVMYYNASAGNNVNSTQASGAYIFRPNGTFPYNMSTNNVPVITLVTSPSNSPVLQEIHQVWNSWSSQVVRLYNDADYLEISPSIGPISILNHAGKEVITRFTTDLKTNARFYTDSNALEFQERIRNYRFTYKLNNTEVVADNYYPIDTAIYMEDAARETRLTVVNDRAAGGGSLNDGQMEFMIHRRLLYDDGRGVGEALNQSDIVRATHWMYVGRPNESAERQRKMSLEMNYPSLLMFASDWEGSTNDWFSQHDTDLAVLKTDLPRNVHLLSLRTRMGGETILRLHHIFSVGEDPVWSKDATVDLAAIFSDLQIESLHEVSLTTVIPIEDLRRYTWKIDGESGTKNGEEKWHVTPIKDFNITLKPMEIRSFIVNFLHV
eukprot:TRINITY_DN9107_c0_g1_i1.p1 TRINITY_DN9107_c0_g1~~TRINITY_DN9107_c0_g1_i1.p1  ORF type:complete len:992 (+),score=187.74 TRINITY_DN9107_c0_g1_i1:420-2978(+)